MKENDLLYYNGYGGFRNDGKEYIIKTKEKTTPLPWAHIIANENFGTIITANGGGYIWHGNSQSNKITAWSNDCLRDTPSEKLVFKIKNREINLLPYDSLEKYEIIYGFGYAKYIYEDEDFVIETIIYVPIHQSKKVYQITITDKKEMNTKGEEMVDASLCYVFVPVLGVSREFTKKHIVIEKVDKDIVMKNRYRENYAEDDIYIKTSEQIKQYECENNILNMSMSFSLKMEKKIQLEIGCKNNYISNKNILLVTEHEFQRYTLKEENFQDVKQDEEELKFFWEEKMKRIKIDTPVESMNIMMNGWLLYQTLCCRMWARTSFYQAGGAFGFRDQLQDSLALLWVDPTITRKQILLHAAHQFEEGDVLHWWHPEKNNGTRTRYSDDLLWLPYVLSKYIAFTGDVTILEERVPYVKSEVLKENEVERYTNVETTAYDDTIYNHAKQAIKYGVKLSPNGLPKMNGGDWNDGMNQIKGQSIWLGFFIYSVLDSFKNVCELKQDEEKKEEYEKILDILKSGLNEFGWDGRWYRRAYFETGEPVGSAQNEECKIDGISQSWAVISGAGEYEKCLQAMDSLDAYLVDKENMIIKLLTPPFDKTELNPGYIKEYIPGVRENGGQYTHGAIWSVIANAILKNGDRAGEYFRILNPIEHARTKENALRYKVEPYVMAADVYASPNMQGRGGWTWYTGSSSWFYVGGLEYILGLNKRKNMLLISPCIPSNWEEYKVEYFFEDTKYEIIVKNPNHQSTGYTSVSLDNDMIKTNTIELQNDKKEHVIEIIM